MKKLYTLIFCITLLALGLSPHKARASHLMGSDITWKCLGGDTFAIEFTIYRDCNGINLSPDRIRAHPVGCSGVSTRNLSSAMGGGEDITPVCAKSCTRCESTACDFQFGIEQYKITTIAVLNGPCCKWKISWDQCCRNGAIGTGISGQLYTDGTIDKCVKPCDNSPYFTNPPVAIFCKNQCVIINPGANDDDRNGKGEADSLSYEFADPLGDISSTLGYSAPYSKEEPLDYTGYPDKDLPFEPPLCQGFHLDAETGDLSFRATKEIVTVVAFSVSEWRKDSTGKPTKIGEVRRDLQIAIIECPDNNAPYIVQNPNKAIIDFCEGQSKCISFRAFDINPKDSVMMSWNKQIKNGTFTVSKQPDKIVTANFCWTPGKSDVRSLPHQFVITVVDNACPVPGRTNKTVRLRVNPSPEATYQAKTNDCGVVNFTAQPTGKDNIGAYEYTWSGAGAERPNGTTDVFFAKGAAASFKYTKGGTYKYNLTILNKNTGCVTIYTDSVSVDPYVGVDLPKDTTLCFGTTNFQVVAVRRDGFPNFAFSWNTGSTSDRITLPLVTKDTVLVVNILDGTGCTNYDSMLVKVNQLPIPKLGPDRRKCLGDTVMLNHGLKDMKKTDWYKLNAAGSAVFFSTGETVPVKDSGDYMVIVSDNAGCLGRDTIRVRFNPLVDVLKQSIDVCKGEVKTASAGTGGTSWSWRNLVRNRIEGTGPTFTSQPSSGVDQIFEVTASQTVFGVTCVDVDTITFKARPLPTPDIRPIPPLCLNNPPLFLPGFGNAAPVGGAALWQAKGYPGAIENNQFLHLDRVPTGLTWIYLTHFDQYGCVNVDSAQVSIDSIPTLFITPDSVVCKQDGRFALVAIPTGGTWTGSGLEKGSTPLDKDVTYFNPSSFNNGDKVDLIYKYVDQSSNAKCSISDTVNLVVLERPTVTATQMDNLCDDGDKTLGYVLDANPGGGIWYSNDPGMDPQAIQQNGLNYLFYPAFAGLGQHQLQYILPVQYEGKSYCEGSDSMVVTVLPKAKLTAATVDGDSIYCLNAGVIGVSLTNDRPGPGTSQYRIDNSSLGLVSNGNNIGINMSILAPGKHRFTYRYTTPEGCETVVGFNFEVQPPSKAYITSATKICDGESSTMTGEGDNANTYNWFLVDGGTIVSGANTKTVVFTPDGNQRFRGRYKIGFVVSQTGNVCGPDTVIEEFLIYPQPKAEFDADILEGCSPIRVTFTSTSQLAERHVWNFGDGTIDSTTNTGVISHVYEKSGTFTVSLIVYSLNGCVDTMVRTNYIQVYQSPIPDFRAKPQFSTIAFPKMEFFSEPYTTGLIGGEVYEWNFGDWNVPGGGRSEEINPVHRYSDTGKYTVSLKIRNPKGCVGDTTKVGYIVIDPEIVVFIPNAFSPDGLNTRATGGRNERFRPVITHFAVATFSVFNRWGELMYESTNMDEGWDGTFNGKACPLDAYVYVVKAVSLSGKEYTFTGTVTLVK